MGQQEGVLQGVALVAHEVRYHRRCTPGDASTAVHEDGPSLGVVVIDELGGLRPEVVDGLNGDVFHVDTEVVEPLEPPPPIKHVTNHDMSSSSLGKRKNNIPREAAGAGC